MRLEIETRLEINTPNTAQHCALLCADHALRAQEGGAGQSRWSRDARDAVVQRPHDTQGRHWVLLANGGPRGAAGGCAGAAFHEGGRGGQGCTLEDFVQAGFGWGENFERC